MFVLNYIIRKRNWLSFIPSRWKVASRPHLTRLCSFHTVSRNLSMRVLKEADVIKLALSAGKDAR